MLHVHAGSMIIERTGNRTVAGLPGWEVEERFPFGLDYREGEQTLDFDCERASGPGVSIILYYAPHGMRWKPPHRGEPLNAAELHPILVRVTAACVLMGIRPIWECVPPEAERKDWPVIWAEAQALLRRVGQ